MNDKPKAPERTHTLKIEIGADSLEAIQAALDHIMFDLYRRTAEGSISGNSVSGGYSWGGTWNWKHDPAVTHESYEKALEEYLAASEGKE